MKPVADTTATISLKSLTSDELLLETEKAVKNERLSTAQVVRYLEEIYARKLYLSRGYPSLFEMAVKHFGFCAGSAQRRITTASTLQGFFISEKRENKAYTNAWEDFAETTQYFSIAPDFLKAKCPAKYAFMKKLYR